MTTDRKVGDYFIGRIHGQLYKDCPSVQVVDLAHGFDMRRIFEPAFVLRNSFNYFPWGTIHILALNCESFLLQKHLVWYNEGHYFICADNGIIPLTFPGRIEKVVNTENIEYREFKPTWLGFSLLASHILEFEGNLEAIGNPVTNYTKLFGFKPVSKPNQITGSVIYIDTFGNVITDISEELFISTGKNRNFKIFAGSKSNVIDKIGKTYSEVAENDLFARFNSYSLLEISIYKQSVAQLFSLELNKPININFYDSQDS